MLKKLSQCQPVGSVSEGHKYSITPGRPSELIDYFFIPPVQVINASWKQALFWTNDRKPSSSGDGYYVAGFWSMRGDIETFSYTAQQGCNPHVDVASDNWYWSGEIYFY